MPKAKRSASWNYRGENWKLSRSKIDLFTQCKKCFYLDNKLGVARPKMPTFTLNVAVDFLLKKEFDIYRAKGLKHPYFEAYGIDAVPFSHENLDVWRENFKGLRVSHSKTGMIISGAVDDLWVNPKGELIIVDYKATSKDGKIESLEDSSWEAQYKRQIEIYQWLFRQEGFKVSRTGYFVYVNGLKDKAAFDKKLEFDVTLIPIKGDDSWVEGAITEIKECLDSEKVPETSPECEFCNYRKLARDAFTKATKPNSLFK